ncbi:MULTISPECIES: tyrosine-type recombinase/integrase [unclassified Enterococcus]|uniref:tyrosine-type recombinase/integrase n=1 Tax=unclassified Enterococcus TaxID=2608891 RepID=UPI001CE09B14|nr:MULTISPECIES: site-specific integrase [unclassified Enterococcus]MCA5012205.1 site-specific integrase [Enterococcus sp. S23]MCA5015456.1 site-specific integrase [Enterococcus sp. S22(2020)]
MAKRGENIYKRKDGRWEGRYIKERNIDGKIRYGYIYSRKYVDVKKKLMLVKAETLKSDVLQITYDGTLGDWLKLWLETIVKPRVKLSTYNGYKSKVQLHILPHIGAILLKELLPTDIDQWLLQLNKQLSSSSVHAVHRVLKNALSQALKQELISKNPTLMIELPKLEKQRVKAFSKQQQKMIKVATIKEEKYLPILIALETGMRIGEISALRWTDIDFSEKTIHIQRTLQRLQVGLGKTALIEGTPKTFQSERVLPLSNQLKEYLTEVKKTSHSPYVVGIKDSCTEPRTITYRFKKLQEELNITPLPFHSLRHTFATRCLELGVNIATISSILGHTSTKMTLDVYTSSFMQDERKAMEKIAAI